MLPNALLAENTNNGLEILMVETCIGFRDPDVGIANVWW
jgi:hypothetical protein